MSLTVRKLRARGESAPVSPEHRETAYATSKRSKRARSASIETAMFDEDYKRYARAHFHALKRPQKPWTLDPPADIFDHKKLTGTYLNLCFPNPLFSEISRYGMIHSIVFHGNTSANSPKRGAGLVTIYPPLRGVQLLYPLFMLYTVIPALSYSMAFCQCMLYRPTCFEHIQIMCNLIDESGKGDATRQHNGKCMVANCINRGYCTTYVRLCSLPSQAPPGVTPIITVLTRVSGHGQGDPRQY